MISALLLATLQLPLAVTPVPAPSAEPGLWPDLRASPSGEVVALWQQPGGSGVVTLRQASWSGGAWSEPATIASGEGWFVNWADFPALAVTPDGTLVASWLERFGASAYAYGVRLSRRAPEASDWLPPRFLHTDRSPTEHGFVSLTPLDGGRVHAVWLDGRSLGESEAAGGASVAEPEHGHMALLAAVIEGGGAVGPELILDRRVCSCCQTDAAVLADGTVLVAYRDRSGEEVRDISLVRGVPGQPDTWCSPIPAGADGWKIHGCPVNGPALAARGQRAAVVWYTEGSRNRPRVLLSWIESPRIEDHAVVPAPAPGPERRVDEGRPYGRADAVFLRDGSLLITWLERTRAGAEWRARLAVPSGALGEPVSIAAVGRGREEGFLRLAPTGDGALAAWTDGATRTMRCARLDPRPLERSY